MVTASKFTNLGVLPQDPLMGLISPKNLAYDAKKSGLIENKAGASRPQVGGESGRGHSEETLINKGLNGNNLKSEPESTYPVEKLVASHHNDAITMDV